MLQKFGILFLKLPADSVFFLFIHSISALKKSLCKILSKIVTVFEAFEILLFRNISDSTQQQTAIFNYESTQP